MARTVDVSVPVEKAEALLDALKDIDGIVGITLHRNASLEPPGDVLQIQATNDTTRAVFNILAVFKVIEGGSISTSQLDSLISPPHQNAIARESRTDSLGGNAIPSARSVQPCAELSFADDVFRCDGSCGILD